MREHGDLLHGGEAYFRSHCENRCIPKAAVERLGLPLKWMAGGDMRRSNLARSVLSLLCLLSAFHSAAAEVQRKDQEVVKIGFASPLTGPQAHYGQDNLNGARMAIEELNTRGVKLGSRPAKFELVVEDDQADPKTGTIVAQRLVDAGIRGMAGHFNSGVTIPASRIYHDAAIPQVSVST